MRDISSALLEKLSTELRADSAILDGEIIAVDERGTLSEIREIYKRQLEKRGIKCQIKKFWYKKAPKWPK